MTEENKKPKTVNLVVQIAPEKKTKTVALVVQIAPEIIAVIDALAQQDGVSRSDVVRWAIRDWIAGDRPAEGHNSSGGR